MPKIDFDTNKEWNDRLQKEDIVAIAGEHFGLYTDMRSAGDGATRCFITQEGYIIPTPNQMPHYKIAQWLEAKGYAEDSSIGCKELEVDYNCVRLNVDREYYLCLPTKKLTWDQLSTLEDILSRYMYDSWGTFTVTNQDGSQTQCYDVDEDDLQGTVDHIINRIRRYYSSGTLYENLEEAADNKSFTSKNLENFFLTKARNIEPTSNFFGGGMYISPYGDLYKIVGDMHIDVFYELYQEGYGSQEEFPDAIFDDTDEEFDEDEIVDQMLVKFEEELGWIRVNAGQYAYEDRVYIALSRNKRPRPLQWDAITDWLYYIKDRLKERKVNVLTQINGILTESNYAEYEFSKYTPEEIVDRMKQFYTTGALTEELEKMNFEVVEDFDNYELWGRGQTDKRWVFIDSYPDIKKAVEEFLHHTSAGFTTRLYEVSQDGRKHEILLYDEDAIQKWSASEFDVSSPQEVANLFGKKVFNKGQFYTPVYDKLTESKKRKGKRRKSKPWLGWWQGFNPDAGDVEYNNSFFNHIMGAEGCTFGSCGNSDGVGEGTTGGDAGGMGESFKNSRVSLKRK